MKHVEGVRRSGPGLYLNLMVLNMFIDNVVSEAMTDLEFVKKMKLPTVDIGVCLFANDMVEVAESAKGRCRVRNTVWVIIELFN